MKCITCQNIAQCPHLIGFMGIFDKERVKDECSDWSPCSFRSQETRDSLVNLLGEYGVMQFAFEGRLKLEGEEVEHVDLGAMLHPDITFAEREHQLRFETDEAGNTVSDEVCEKRPRPAITLRKYAHGLGLTHGQSVGMTIDQIIKYILSTEIEKGLLVREKKPKKGPELAQKETEMAEGKRILLPRRREPEAPATVSEPAKGPEVAAARPTGAKIGRPPSRPRAEAVNQSEPHVVSAPMQASSNGDLAAELSKFLLPEIQVRVAEVVEAKLAETVNRVVSALAQEIQKGVENLQTSQASESEKVLCGITALHDLMATNGVIQWVDPESNEKSPLELLLPENKTVMIYVPE